MIIGLTIVAMDLMENIMTPLQQNIERTVHDVKVDWLNSQFETVKYDIRNHINEIKMKITTILKTK